MPFETQRFQPPFADRLAAGRELAAAVGRCEDVDSSALVLALPRGGVPVAAPVAAALGATLDVLVVRKVALPSCPELALGAVSWDRTSVENPDVLMRLSVDPPHFDRLAEGQALEVERRTRLCRGSRPLPDVRGRTVVLVDDGIATGATVRVALAWLRKRGVGRIVLAVPLVGMDVACDLRPLVDELVALHVPDDLDAVGRWYREFDPVGDDEVVRLLGRQGVEARRG